MVDKLVSAKIFGTSELLRSVRSLRVCAYLPDNRDCEELMLHLQRIGCRVHASWPPSPSLPDDTDLAFLAVRPKHIFPDWAIDRDSNGPAIIAVVDYENPTTIDAVLKIEAENIITSPIKSFGLLSSIVHARQVRQIRHGLQKENHKLKGKILGLRNVAEAKVIVMRARRVSEETAYKYIRDQAMLKRTTVEKISVAIVEANKILPLDV